VTKRKSKLSPRKTRKSVGAGNSSRCSRPVQLLAKANAANDLDHDGSSLARQRPANSKSISVPDLKKAPVESASVHKLAQSYTGILSVCTYAGIARTIVDIESLGSRCGMGGDQIALAVHDAFADFVDSMAPRDPLEKLMLEQLLLNHVRVLQLSQQACAQSGPETIRILNECADRASGAFRRLITAFAEYRKPRTQPIVAIANQQLVVSQQSHGTKNYGEQSRIRPQPQTLSALYEGAEVTTGSHSTNTTMEAKYRSKDAGGKGRLETERIQTRRALRGRNCLKTVDQKHNSTDAG
jgi:hypothetical protein